MHTAHKVHKTACKSLSSATAKQSLNIEVLPPNIYN